MELLPCPFCGSNDKDIFECEDDYNVERLYCRNCECSNTKEYWNTRHLPWISVKDRLPPIGRKVIIFNQSTHFAWINKDNEFKCPYTNFIINHITHWQPLPRPPKGDQ
jgi:hypothetical protein